MDRRTFIRDTAAAVALPGLLPGLARGAHIPAPGLNGDLPGPMRDPRALIIDAMGELRPIYEPPLVRQMLASGTDSITVTLCDPKFVGAEALDTAVDGMMEYDRYLAAHPDLFVKATKVADIDEARRSGRMAVFYLFQNATQFDDDLDRVEMFHKLGLTSCQVTYNERNLAGVGCRAQGDEGGLTQFGRDMIDRMNGTGMLVDLSHANEQTMADTIEHSRMPVILSHTGCDAVHPHERNTSDANLRAMAERGGVVGVCQLRPFLTEKKQDNLHAYFDHIDHAVQVCGTDHVGIGSDRDHRVIEMTPEYEAELRAEEGNQVSSSELPYYIDELNGPTRMTVVWDGLVERGYSAEAIEKIMGGNVYRIYEEVIG
jgi:membrane dipeptidase